tara:strand:+ start:951 stop:1739 length:789 start_codon:yes stop_codon:yes gene_type:complete
MMKYNNLIFEEKKDFYLVKINRPKFLNALNQETINELTNCFEFINENSKNKYGVIVTGEGEKAFVAGADIKEFNQIDEKSSIEFCKNGHYLFNLIENMSIPVLALVNGYALGGGCELSLACHFRIATENAQFSQPEINLGLIPGYGGTQRLTQIIGKSKALEMMLTANMVTSKEALDFGLVNYVVKDFGTGLDKCNDIILTIKRKAPVAIKNVIKSVNNFYSADADGFEEEIKLFSECSSTKDFKEGVKAFLEKRCPDFRGD